MRLNPARPGGARPVPDRLPGLLALLFLSGLGLAGPPAPPPPAGGQPAAAQVATAPPDRSEVRLTVGEEPILAWLRAATPYTLTLGGPVVGTDLVFQDPSDLHLKDGTASLRIRVRGKALPIDQVVSPVVSVIYDPNLNKYFGVFSSLMIQVPGLGTVDLKDYVPRFEIPDVLEDLWRFSDRPVGLTLRIRRIAIRDRLLEVGADVIFGPGPSPGARSAR